MTTAPTPAFPMTWKELYDQTEAFWSKPLHQLLGSETMSAAFGLTRDNALTQHQLTREVLERYWETLRLPSMKEHTRLASQVVALENKVEGVEDRLQALHDKLDTIQELLARMSEEAPSKRHAAK